MSESGKTADDNNSQEVPKSAKNKGVVNNKPKASDSGLTEIIEGWPGLPNDIQSAVPFVRGLD